MDNMGMEEGIGTGERGRRGRVVTGNGNICYGERNQT